jgi:hypothetical protein
MSVALNMFYLPETHWCLDLEKPSSDLNAYYLFIIRGISFGVKSKLHITTSDLKFKFHLIVSRSGA